MKSKINGKTTKVQLPLTEPVSASSGHRRTQSLARTVPLTRLEVAPPRAPLSVLVRPLPHLQSLITARSCWVSWERILRIPPPPPSRISGHPSYSNQIPIPTLDDWSLLSARIWFGLARISPYPWQLLLLKGHLLTPLHPQSVPQLKSPRVSAGHTEGLFSLSYNSFRTKSIFTTCAGVWLWSSLTSLGGQAGGWPFRHPCSTPGHPSSRWESFSSITVRTRLTTQNL